MKTEDYLVLADTLDAMADLSMDTYGREPADQTQTVPLPAPRDVRQQAYGYRIRPLQSSRQGGLRRITMNTHHAPTLARDLNGYVRINRCNHCFDTFAAADQWHGDPCISCGEYGFEPLVARWNGRTWINAGEPFYVEEPPNKNDGEGFVVFLLCLTTVAFMGGAYGIWLLVKALFIYFTGP